MNEFDKAIKSISNKIFICQYQKELLKILEEKERENWIKEQLKLCEQPSTYEIIKSISELEPKPLSIDTQISNIKHQLKHEKNPLVIKNLNRKMNKLIKEKNKELFNFIWYDLLPIIIMLAFCFSMLFFVYFKIFY